MMSGSANPPSCSGEVSIAMANATSDSSLFKRPVDGKPRLLPSPTIRPGSPLRSSNKGHPARFSLWSCPAGGLAAARPTSPTHHMRDSDRGSSPSRLRSVTSMRALLPLQLGTGGGRGSSSLVCLTSQLRRTNSDPTANGQLGLRSPTSNTLVESVSMSLSTLSSTPTLGGVKAQQALFDIGIFRPSIESQASPLAGAGSIEFEGEIGRCARAVSPTEESTLSLVDDIVGESEHDNVSDVGMDGVSQLDDEGHQDTASECSSMTSSQGMITISALPECLVSSALGIRNTASESECPNQNLNEASWLEDASDDEGINGNSNLSRGLRLDEAFFQDRLKDVSNRPKLYNVQDTRIEYATAVSPARATLVDVSSKRSSTCSIEVQSSSTTSSTNITIPEESSVSASPSFQVPVTPPSSPQCTFLDMDGGKKAGKRVMVDTSHVIKAMTTPPQSPESALSMSRMCATEAGLADILEMIERAIAGFPSTLLQADSKLTARIRGHTTQPTVSHPAALERSLRQETSLPNTGSSTKCPTAGGTSPGGCPTSFRTIFDATSDTLPSAIYSYIITISFLDDLLLTPPDQSRRQTLRSRSVCIESSKCSHIKLNLRIKSLRYGLNKCLRRLIEGVVGLDGESEIFLRALTAVVRLEENVHRGWT